ncbi:MAG: hypothetical protein IAE80_16940 [Anaerolinea sp.]|nr:hypothetical protein [Anaerolinea sp.]
MKLIRTVLFIVILLASSSLTFAQTTDSPLLDLLALVPDAPHGDLFYADFAAIEQAYPAAQAPANWAEYAAWRDSSGEDLLASTVWWRVFSNFNSEALLYFTEYDRMPEVMGIDVFQIDRVVYDGFPPQQVYYLAGDFDLAAIQAALTARNFTPEATGTDLELWCGEVGCENSDQMNLQLRDVADIFGGDLGRQWARLISSDLMIGANQFASLQQVEATLAGDQASLAENSLYRAAVGAVADQGVVLQATILSPDALEQFADPLLLFPFGADAAVLAEAYARLLDQDFETLPQYDAVLAADVVNESKQMLQVVLIYTDETDATEAARIVPERIAEYESLANRRPFADLLEDFYVAPVTAEVVPLEGAFAVRVTFATRLATPEEIVQLSPQADLSDLPEVTAPGLLYRIFVRGYATRDLGWLSTASREQIEALAGN